MKRICVFLLILILGLGMIELVGERRYTTKVFKQNLGAPNNIGEFHIGHIHYIPLGETEYQDSDFTYTEYANRWELTKASYNLTIYNRFNGPRLIEWFNYFEGANHTIRFEPYALVWVDMTDPLNESEWHVIGMAQNVQGIEVDDKIIYSDAFGTDLDFIIQKRRSGLRKLVRINSLSALGARPSVNHEVIALFNYTGPGLKIRARGASQDWDELTYYEGMDGFEISEIADDSKKSIIRRATAFDSSSGVDKNESRLIKVFWAYHQNALWQAKVIPYDYLSASETVFPVLADTQTTFYSGSGDGYTLRWNPDADWSTCRNGSGTGSGDTDEESEVRNQYAAAGGGTYRCTASDLPFYLNLGSGETINSVTLRVYGTGYTVNEEYGINVTEGDQADPTQTQNSDYQRRDWTEFCDTRLIESTYSIGGWNEFSFNASGISYIDGIKTTWAKLAVLGGADIDNNLSGSGNRYTIANFEFSEHTGGHDPQLVVDYGAVTPKSVSDSGSGSDSVSIKVLTTISDVGNGADSPSLKALLSLADTGSGADLLSILAKLAISDVGSGADIIGIKNLISILDSGSGADVLSILRKIAILDSGLGTDAIALIKAILTIADSGTGTDIVSVNTGATQKKVSDAGMGTEALSILAKLSILDSGSALDTAGIKALLSLSDVGSGVDAVTIKQFKSISDSGLATEILAIKNMLSVVDAGLGADAFSLLVKVAIQDSGLASELVSVVTGVVFPILYQVEPRDRIFNVKARERMFRVEPRERTPDTGKRGN